MNIVIAIVILCGVILFHELGHFIAARACGITVLEFAFGLGPKILSRKIGETEFSWRAIPVGGMCRMLGEDEDTKEPGSFQSAKVWQRILVVAAGPVFNFILAFLAALVVIFSVGADPARVVEVGEGTPAAEAGLMEGDVIIGYEGSGISNGRELSVDMDMDGVPLDRIDLRVKRGGERVSVSYVPDTIKKYMLGYRYAPDDEPAAIDSVVPGLPMDEAGLESGDIITSVDGVSIESGADLERYLSEHPFTDRPVTIRYTRNGRERTAEVTPTYTETADTGFSFNLAREKQGFFSSVAYGFAEVKYWIKVTVKSLLGLITGKFSVRDLSGPVGVVSTIGKVYNEAKNDGALILIMTMLNMMILLSANLGVVNLVPFPALDGGRILFLIIEAIRRKPIKQSVEGMIHFIGFAALMVLMVFVVFQDIARLI